MGAMAGVENGIAGKMPGRFFGQAGQAMVAFLAKADPGRPRKLEGDLPSGPMAQDHVRKGGGDGEEKMKGDRGEAQNPASATYPSLVFHRNIIPSGRQGINRPNRAI